MCERDGERGREKESEEKGALSAVRKDDGQMILNMESRILQFD